MFEKTKSFYGEVALLKFADAEKDMLEVQTAEKNSHKQFEIRSRRPRDSQYDTGIQHHRRKR